MSRRVLLPVLVVFPALQCASCSAVREYQPNVPQGGRAVTIAVHPTIPLQMYVASETGGLFSTTNGGSN